MYVHANCMHICTTNSVYASLEQNSSSSWFVGAEVESLGVRASCPGYAFECARSAPNREAAARRAFCSVALCVCHLTLGEVYLRALVALVRPPCVGVVHGGCDRQYGVSPSTRPPIIVVCVTPPNYLGCTRLSTDCECKCR